MIRITSPYANGATVDGAVRIEGTSALKKVWFFVLGPQWGADTFPVDCDGSFGFTLYLRYGAGTYTIFASDSSGAFDGSITLTVSNTSSIDQIFLKPSAYVDSDNAEIVALARSICLPTMTEAEKTRAIYDWVTENVAYDVDGFVAGSPLENRAKASQVLKSKRGICLEYSYLVAALARAAGLQAKVICGYLRGSRVNHAWNEVYAGGKWIVLDTTLGAGIHRGSTFTKRVTSRYFDTGTSVHVPWGTKTD
ncbi:MAG: transglutaminase-like domain-containing protein [Bacillota bacterium]|nr:transglutaminase-like domain-containing protein [Bacillota bacterium]